MFAFAGVIVGIQLQAGARSVLGLLGRGRRKCMLAHSQLRSRRFCPSGKACVCLVQGLANWAAREDARPPRRMAELRAGTLPITRSLFLSLGKSMRLPGAGISELCGWLGRSPFPVAQSIWFVWYESFCTRQIELTAEAP